ncbi:trypsin-like peptidase domain-containing protein [Saccharopolyspora hirsuta]|uniref:nSTAND1 domain-containing NTPase n=1 Tax=Saccharopolyspora hirsuta TaxID=1837 RepID=UPI00331A8F40
MGGSVGPALVRLRAGRRTLGAGFLVAPDVVATCAHVVDAGLVADFPFLSSLDHAVEVLERDDELDIAILRLTDPPPGALPAPARISGEVRDHRFRTFGFPHDMPDGIWVTGRLLGAEGSGRIQMAVDPDHWRIEPGFSGAPVWDEELAGVVGMVVTASVRSGTTAHLVPTSALGAAWTTPARNPYRGLRPFREEDAELFHGREADTDRLFDLVRRQDVVAVAGPSGSGKSSLVRAGLIPKLKQHGRTVVYLGPNDEIPESPAPGAVLVLDQFEETVAADPAAAREKLAAVIRLAGKARTVLTLRSRSLDELITKETVDELNRAVWFLEPMSREQLAAAVEGPAEVVGGLAFESGLVQRILDDTEAEPGTLPLLSLVLDQLWQHRHGGWLTHDAYEQLGRLPGAISTAADGALASLDIAQRRAARQLLTRLTRPDGEGGHARRSADMNDLTPDLHAIAQELAARRLITIQDERVDLAHQALIDHWPTLRTWLDQDVDFLAWQAKLHDLRNSGGQLTGAPLAEALDWLNSRSADIGREQRDFINRSEANRRRSQRRWRAITAVSAVLALVALLLTGVVARYAAQTREQLRTSNTAELAEASGRVIGIDPRQSLQFALAAYAEKPDSPEAYGALFQQRVYWHGVERFIPSDLLPDAGIWSMLSSADGRTVVIYPGNWSKAPSVWKDLHGPDPQHRVLPVDPDVSPPAFVRLSPDGRFLAVSAKENRGLRVLDLANQDREVELIAQPEQIEFAGFSANSRFLSAEPADERQPVRVWDLTSGRELPSAVVSDVDPISEAHPSPDGRSLITREEHALGGDEQTSPVVVRDLATGARVRTLPAGTYDRLVGGGTLLISCQDTELRGTDPLTGRSTGTLPNSVECSDLDTDLSGQYLLPYASPDDGRKQIVHWPSWQRMYTEIGSSSNKLVLIPRDDRSATAITDLGGALAVRTAETSSAELGDYDSFTRAPGSDRWAATRRAESGDLELFLLDGSGAVLASTPVPNSAGSDDTPPRVDVSFDGSGQRVALAIGPVLRTYRADGLVFERELQAPGQDSPAPGDRTQLLPGPDGNLLVSTQGVLSAWDLGTGAQTSPPLVLEAPGPRGELPDTSMLTARPGHPEQLLVTTDGKVAVWDIRARRALAAFPVPEGTSTTPEAVVSADGAHAAFGQFNGPVSVLDLDSLREVSTINAEITSVVGFSDHYLFVQRDGLEVWDWRLQRAVTGAAEGRAAIDNAAFEGDEFFLDDRPGHRDPIPMDPERWFADLCRIGAREFTPEELRTLPPGASAEPPCG